MCCVSTVALSLELAVCMVNRYDDGHCDFVQSQTPTNNNELAESLIREHNNPAQETRNPNYNGPESTYKYYMIFILTLYVACCLCLLLHMCGCIA